MVRPVRPSRKKALGYVDGNFTVPDYQGSETASPRRNLSVHLMMHQPEMVHVWATTAEMIGMCHVYALTAARENAQPCQNMVLIKHGSTLDRHGTLAALLLRVSSFACKMVTE